MVGDPYKTTLTASGGSHKYQWSLVSPLAMPAGLVLDEKTGTISGQPDTLAEGPTSITVQVDDSNTTAKRTFSLMINPGLRISRDADIEGPDSIKLKATGGGGTYTWDIVNGNEDGCLEIDHVKGIIKIVHRNLPGIETRHFTVSVKDKADKPHTDQASFSIVVRSTSWWRHPFRREISGLGVKFSRKRRWPSFARLDHLTFWLAFLALETPVFGAAWIIVYAFATPGKHGIYLSVGMLTAIAAFLIGILIGFLFGIPKVISSGQARLGQSSGYTPSSNLSEVSDWLTKLLLGAGLVQLTHLGAPIGALINHIAAGLHTTKAYSGAATVAAGTIIFGYVALGLLNGYVVTTMWYQRRLARLNP